MMVLLSTAVHQEALSIGRLCPKHAKRFVGLVGGVHVLVVLVDPDGIAQGADDLDIFE